MTYLHSRSHLANLQLIPAHSCSVRPHHSHAAGHGHGHHQPVSSPRKPNSHCHCPVASPLHDHPRRSPRPSMPQPTQVTAMIYHRPSRTQSFHGHQCLVNPAQSHDLTNHQHITADSEPALLASRRQHNHFTAIGT